MYLQFILFVVFCWGASGQEVPSFIPLCNRQDIRLGDCFTNSLYELMPRLTSVGIPEIDVPPIDPLVFSHLPKVDTGNTGSVNLMVQIKNGTVTGLRKLKIKNHKMNLDEVLSTVKLHLPEINLEANYNARGRILLFELNGNGHASFNASDITTDAVWSGSYYTKLSKKHLSLDHVEFNNIKIGKMAIRLDRIFGDNELLTDTVNKALNEDIDSLKEEVEPIIKAVLSDAVIEYFNRVYRLFPVEQLFPDN